MESLEVMQDWKGQTCCVLRGSRRSRWQECLKEPTRTSALQLLRIIQYVIDAGSINASYNDFSKCFTSKSSSEAVWASSSVTSFVFRTPSALLDASV